MKTFFVTGIAMLIFASVEAQTTIPNAGFENWSSSGSYENPDLWDSPNDVTSSLGKIVVEKEAVYVHGGSYSAMITVLSSIAGTLPGVLTLGDFSFDLLSMSATIDGGTAFSGRPEKMIGWYQYEPNNNDICLIGAFLLKDNAGVWDTIATAGFETSATVLTWTEFEAVFDYRSTETPTHMNIILMPTDRNYPQIGSTIYIDDLSFSYPQSIAENNQNNLRAFSDRSSDIVRLQFPETNEALLSVFDVSGRRLLSADASGSEYNIDMSSVPDGAYFVTLQESNNVYSIKIIW